ncbi:Zinc finger, C2HC5-type protein [Ceratobasidium sp. AG-Ba]|nr:Zinc finger, C2HC5-type protein [Ceratobasidium sp. AG-Ba]
MSKKGSTAWASNRPQRGGGGSLTSDMLSPRRPSPAPPQNQAKTSKPKTNAASSELLKSREVKRLERLIDEVSTGVVDSRAASKPGCFCLAKTHALSAYVPLCKFCGIILCSLHNPALPCPSCSSPLLPPATRNALLAQLEQELANQLVLEAEKREEQMRAAREIELHNSGGGHFPTLTGKPDARSAQTQAPRKVLSLNSSTKKATLSTFMAVPSPPASNPASGRASPVENRIPAPIQAPVALELTPEMKLLARQRPWADWQDPTPIYVPPEEPKLAVEEEQDTAGGGERGKSRKRRGGRGGGRGGQNSGAGTERVVPGAGGSRQAT